MKAEEKAKALVSKYETEFLETEYMISGFVIWKLAKKSALMAVDEIISDYENCSHDIIPHKYFEKAVDFWKEVKSEIIEL